MKFMWSIFLVVALVTPRLVGAAPVVQNKAQHIESKIPGEAPERNVFLSVGPGLAVYGGNLGWAVNIGALGTAFDRNLYVGLDAGLNFWNFESPNTAVIVGPTNATGIQLTPTLVYRFEIPGPLFPYIGLSVGPNIYVENVRVGGATTTQTTALFEGLIRPGFYAELGKTVSLQVEAKFGVLRESFIFLPQASAVFAL